MVRQNPSERKNVRHGKEGEPQGRPQRHSRLRTGFSTGTAMTAAARAALRTVLTGKAPAWVAVRLPVGYYLPVPTSVSRTGGMEAEGQVVKDAGDDPDVTHKAVIHTRVRIVPVDPPDEAKIRPIGTGTLVGRDTVSEIRLSAGFGVGRVTKPGLPVPVGDPAVNPGPRAMLLENLEEELAWFPAGVILKSMRDARLSPPDEGDSALTPVVRLPLRVCGKRGTRVAIHVHVSIPRGEELARQTLNPRLGIVGGLSILGTTGLVKPLSHEAYEETIVAALRVAAAGRCRTVVLSTGGKSEKFARELLSEMPEEAFVQIADFFAFSVQEAARAGFEAVVHSVFFGKAVKMAAGLPYTHAHKAALDLNTLVRCGEKVRTDPAVLDRAAQANTARHALEILLESGAQELIHEVAREALRRSRRFAGPGLRRLRLLLFDYDGTLLADVHDAEGPQSERGIGSEGANDSGESFGRRPEGSGP